jgi:hypothetical protein
MKVMNVLFALKFFLGCIVVLATIAGWLLGSREEAESPVLVDETSEQCRTLARALDVVGYQRHRPDLAQVKDGMPTCARPDLEGCAYLVEVGFELLQADRQDLAAQVSKSFDVLDCSEELRFAVKYGLETYRDARVLVAKAVRYDDAGDTLAGATK